MGLSRVGSGGKGGEDFPPPGGGEEEGEERRGSQTPVDPKGSADILNSTWARDKLQGF